MLISIRQSASWPLGIFAASVAVAYFWGNESRAAPDARWSASLASPVCCDAATHVGIVRLWGSIQAGIEHKNTLAEVNRTFPLYQIVDQMVDNPKGIDSYQASFALVQLSHLISGEVDITGDIISIKGNASRQWHSRLNSTWPADVKTILPGTIGLKLGTADVTPRNDAGQWSISRSENQIMINGFAPSDAKRNEIMAEVLTRFPSDKILDTTKISPSASNDFATAMKLAVDQLGTSGTKSVWVSDNKYQINMDDTLFSDEQAKTDALSAMERTARSKLPPAYMDIGISAADKSDDTSSITFFYATDRKEADENGAVRFGGDRGPEMLYGVIKVHVPTSHVMGHLELPKPMMLLWVVPWGPVNKDPASHFVINGIEKMDFDNWRAAVSQASSPGILVFVPGYSNTFEDSVYRMAQIVADLQFKGAAVLYSWPSKGDTLAYEYDRNSALISRTNFVKLLRALNGLGDRREINIICHSMGNFLSIDALAGIAQYQTSDVPLVIDQIVLAAPDIDVDQYRAEIPQVVGLSRGVTLYASSADKALQASEAIAMAPRAGEVTNGVPVLAQGVDAIDVTAIGGDPFGIDHDTYASTRSIIDDIKLVLKGMRPPNERLAEIRGMPLGDPRPQYWRYVP